MTTNWPGAVDSFSVKVDNVDDVLAAHVNNLQDPVVALETALGVEGPTGLCEGRLTLLSGSPITLDDQTAKTTVYFTPHLGNRISLYDGSDGWITHTFTEKSMSVPATTVTPFDIFAYSDGGTVTLEALTWTNDTTRATALTYQDGIYVKTGATTRRYLGTCRTTSVNGQTEDSKALRFVWNYYNRLERRLELIDSTSHDYNTGAWRAWNNDPTILTAYIIGVVEDSVLATAVIEMSRDATNDGFPAVRLYLNAGAIGTHTILNVVAVYTNRNTNTAVADPRAGYNFYNVYEFTFAGVAAPTFAHFTLGARIRG